MGKRRRKKGKEKPGRPAGSDLGLLVDSGERRGRKTKGVLWDQVHSCHAKETSLPSFSLPPPVSARNKKPRHAFPVDPCRPLCHLLKSFYCNSIIFTIKIRFQSSLQKKISHSDCNLFTPNLRMSSLA